MEQRTVITRSPFTIVLGGNSKAEAETELRLAKDAESDFDAAPSASAIFTSLHKTAIALVNVASEQAIERASVSTAVEVAPHSTEFGVPRQDGLEEHRPHIIQIATAEQARRAAECMRNSFDALLRNTTQPCFALDAVSTVIRWNGAMAHWTGVPERDALGRPLSSIFCAESAVQIEAVNLLFREAEERRSEVDADPLCELDGEFTFRDDLASARISLLPLCRIPQIVETVVVLVTLVSSR
jgi:PAS domain-containing protein